MDARKVIRKQINRISAAEREAHKGNEQDLSQLCLTIKGDLVGLVAAMDAEPRTVIRVVEDGGVTKFYNPVAPSTTDTIKTAVARDYVYPLLRRMGFVVRIEKR